MKIVKYVVWSDILSETVNNKYQQIQKDEDRNLNNIATKIHMTFVMVDMATFHRVYVPFKSLFPMNFPQLYCKFRVNQKRQFALCEENEQLNWEFIGGGTIEQYTDSGCQLVLK